MHTARVAPEKADFSTRPAAVLCVVERKEKLMREAVSKKRRFDVFKRDGFTCQYCGATPPGVLLHVDHINPVALGGKGGIDNLITACEPCNLGKGARPLSDIPPSLAEKAAAAKEREAQITAYNKVLAAAAKRIEDDAWDVANIFMDAHSKDSIRRDYFRSIKLFLDRLPKQQVIDAMESAVSAVNGQDRIFRYFCGVCWNKIKGAA